MTAPCSLESEYLRPTEDALRMVLGKNRESDFELRMQILEAVSARFGGYELAKFHKVFGIQSVLPVSSLLELAAPVASEIERSPIQSALALSILSREPLQEQDKKKTGAYHTDFRLATRLAQLAASRITYRSVVIDPACGTGILLAALTYAVCGLDRAKTSYWLSHCVCAADLSKNSLRAALLCLASFTDDLEAIKLMRNRWFCGDSLLANKKIWLDMAPEGFDAVIGNPPWEKIKLSRHEFLKSSGTKRHYGAQINEIDESCFATERHKVASYSQELLKRYPNLGCGEPDLYIAFADLFFDLCREKGIVSALFPGGFIRSQGTQAIRQKMFSESSCISLSVISNQAKFFTIDTRFKFLAVALIKDTENNQKRKPIRLLHEHGTSTGLDITGKVTIGRKSLTIARTGLSLPEVRSNAEWRLFLKISRAGLSWMDAQNGWRPKFCREVDMTKERLKFLRSPVPGALPVIEGRMVQGHRFGVKGYISGTGRRSIWETYPIGESRILPQFWIKSSDVPQGNRHRIDKVRVGFCDIAGQTNERSLMASIIPEGVVCGNKVPTLLFPDDPTEERLLVWVAIANSFVFDWMLRRVLTTTVNYFLLQSLPLPNVVKKGLPWNRLVKAAKRLRELDKSGATYDNLQNIARLRRQIDAEVAIAYGLNVKDMELIFVDFPLLDRQQVALPGEDKSTITRDSVLSEMEKRTGIGYGAWTRRMEEGNNIGAVAYVPNEFSIKIGAVGRDKGGVYG